MDQIRTVAEAIRHRPSAVKTPYDGIVFTQEMVVFQTNTPILAANETDAQQRVTIEYARQLGGPEVEEVTILVRPF